MRPGSALEEDLKVVQRHLPALNYLGKKGHTVSMDERHCDFSVYPAPLPYTCTCTCCTRIALCSNCF